MSNTEMKPVPRSLRAALVLAWIVAIIWVALVSAPRVFGAIRFDATGDAFACGTADNGVRPDGAFFVSLWFKPADSGWESDGASRVLITHKNAANFQNYFRIHKFSDNKIYCGFVANNTLYEANATAITTSEWQTAFDGTIWNHLLFRQYPISSTQIHYELIINGTTVKAADATIPVNYAATGQVWCVGNWASGSSEDARGDIAEFAQGNIYPSDAQVAALAAGKNPLDAIGMGAVRQYVTFKDYSLADRLGLNNGAWSTTGGTVDNVLAHPDVESTWPDFKPSASPGSSKFVERLLEWTKGVSGSSVWVFDTTDNVPNLLIPAAYADPTNAVMSTPGILPGDSRTCAFLDGSGDYFDTLVANEATFDFDVLNGAANDVTFGAVVQVDYGLANAVYPVFSKLGASTAYAGFECSIVKDSNGHYATLSLAVNTGTNDRVHVKTPDASIPVGRPVCVQWGIDAVASGGAITNSSVFITIDGIVQTLTTVGSADASITGAGGTLNNNTMYIGRAVRASTEDFKGKIAVAWIVKEKTSFARISSLGLLALNDVPDLAVADVQGNLTRPGDLGYKPTIILDIDAADDYGETNKLEQAAMLVDAGRMRLAGIVVGNKNGQDNACVVPAAIRKLRRLSAPIGVWKGAAIGSTPVASAWADDIASSSFGSGLAAENTSYPDSLAVVTRIFQTAPDRSIVWTMGGHADVLNQVLADATAGPLADQKLAFVVIMAGAYNFNTAGTLCDSENYDVTDDSEYNVEINPDPYVTLFAALESYKIPYIVLGFNYAVRGASSTPTSGKAFGYMTTTSTVPTAAVAAGAAADAGRAAWDPDLEDIACHGVLRCATGGGEWLGRGTFGVSTSGTPLGGQPAGYTRFTRTPLTSSGWVLWFDDGANGIRTREIVNQWLDRYITLAERDRTYGILGDRTTIRRRTYIFD